MDNLKWYSKFNLKFSDNIWVKIYLKAANLVMFTLSPIENYKRKRFSIKSKSRESQRLEWRKYIRLLVHCLYDTKWDCIYLYIYIYSKIGVLSGTNMQKVCVYIHSLCLKTKPSPPPKYFLTDRQVGILLSPLRCWVEGRGEVELDGELKLSAEVRAINTNAGAIHI